MHTEIEMIVHPSYTDELIGELQQLEGVISLSVVREASIKPPGDVFTAHVLNRQIDEVLRLADAARVHGQVSVSTSELSSMIDPEHERKARVNSSSCIARRCAPAPSPRTRRI